MSLTVIIIGAFVVIGVALWMYFGGGDSGGEAPAPQPSSFRCKICAKTFPTFVDAHEHASADHDLAGHRIDESIEAQ